MGLTGSWGGKEMHMRRRDAILDKQMYNNHHLKLAVHNPAAHTQPGLYVPY